MPASRDVHLLAYVLGYEDLAADDAGNFRIEALPLTIGRDFGDRGPRWRAAGDELRLRDRWLSARHAELAAVGDELVVRDLGSRNGVHVDGVRLDEPRPLRDGDLIEVGHSLLCYRRTTEEAAARACAAPALGPTRTRSPAGAALAADLRALAPGAEPVLLLGEIGTGKEVAADDLHRWSGRRGPHVVVDCALVPEPLVEATFLGRVAGAGEIDRARGGTLLLDEIGETSPAIQATLARAIDAAGDAVRWVAATHHALLHPAARFDRALLARFGGQVVRLPPLRDRREDLGVLAAHVIREAGVAAASIASAAARALFPSAFPGNIQQLRVTLRSALALARGRRIEPAHLELETTRDLDESFDLGGPVRRDLPPGRDELAAALDGAAGNVVLAAERLGTTPRDLCRWLARARLT